MEEPRESGGARPSVGNVLGFSLLLRDRRALLRLERRALAPGLRLTDYEAEVPGVQFPLRAQGAAAFRRLRCTARRLRLEVEPHALRGWLRRKLVGQIVHGLRIDDAELELAAPGESDEPQVPRLCLRGHHEGRPQWLMIEVQLRPRGRRLELRPWRIWRLGEGELDVSALWRGTIASLGGTEEPDTPDARVLDPVRSVLLRAFVSAGWRAPDLGALHIESIDLRPERATLSLVPNAEGTPARSLPPEAPRDEGHVEERLDRIRAALRSGQRPAAAAQLERLADTLASDHPARVEVLRWLAATARGHDPAQELRALKAWLHLAPRDDAAARALVLALGRAGNDRALAQRLTAECRLPHPPRRQAQLELALATVLVDRLDEPTAGGDLLRPLLERCGTTPETADLELPGRACLARALASRPAEALAELRRALECTDRSALSASIRAGVAAALDRRGHHDCAQPLWLEVVSIAPDDDELVDQALASARAGVALEAVVEILRLAIASAEPERALALRRALVSTLLESSDEAQRELGVAELRALVREQPLSTEFTMQLSALEQHRGHPERAASSLTRLVATTDDREDRVRLQLEQARLLAEGAQPRRAWAYLEPALEQAPPALEPELLELALGIAPISIRDRLLDRLVEIDLGPRSGQALLARAEGRTSDSRRRADLELAAQRLDDPRPALHPLLALCAPDDIQPAAALANACAAQSDIEGERAARVELALRHLQRDELDAAAEALAKAEALGPEAPALTLALGWVEARTGQIGAATRQLVLAIIEGMGLDLAPLRDPRLAMPSSVEDLRARLSTLLVEAQRPVEAAKLLQLMGAAVEGPARLRVYEALAQVDPEEVDALLILAEHEHRDGEFDRARGHWERALARLDDDDARRIAPSLTLARHELTQGSAERAHALLLPLRKHSNLSREAHELLAEVAEARGDSTTHLQALRSILVHHEAGPERAKAELSLARILGETGRAPEALAHAAAAVEQLDRGSPEHIDATRTWLSLALEVNEDPQHEAAARAELRLGLGQELSTKEVRAEALLQAERLDDPQAARALVEAGLAEHPADALLLSTLEHLIHESGGPTLPYLVALEAAIEDLEPGDPRDQLATQLATNAAQEGDATRVYRALERMSAHASGTEDMLELRSWAIDRLGLTQDELRLIDQRLNTGNFDPGTIARLSRLVGEGEPTIVHLVELARKARVPVARRLVEPALAMATPLAIPSLTMQVLRLAVQVGASDAAARAWPSLVECVSTTADDAALADLVALADDAREAGMVLDDRLDRLLDATIAHQPSSPHLHRALERHLARSREIPAEQLHAELSMHLDAVADRYELPGRDRAELFIGIAEPLDRRAAADLLATRAQQYLGETDAFDRLIEALEARHSWPEVLRLLGERVQIVSDNEARVVTLKHLAHIASEILGDPSAAMLHLEAALKLAPSDPDLLLPLLEHHFSQTDLLRAIELTERVLEHVSMGDAAFAALAHRAADAAIAGDRAPRAADLLERVVERIPAADKARTRLAELRSRADDPAQKVQLLGAVAARQSGKSRIEALEERARLLLDPLGRPVEAMEDLAAVVAEAPDREASARLLTELYTEHRRFAELVAVLEAELPRRHGLPRALLLHKLAAIHRDQLLDLPRAEQALRLAIEELGESEPEQNLGDTLRQELVDNLETQGRYVDLTVYLEEELAAELDSDRPSEIPPPTRIALLQILARVVRAHLDDEARAARLYEHLERWHALPDEGLASLARWYRRSRRHDDLVRVLKLRALAFEEHGERRAAIDLRIAELLDGPLARPHDAAPYYLDTYLADPEANPAAGARARVLLSAVDSVANVRERLLRRLDDLALSRQPALLTLLADILAPHEDHELEAEARYREAIELEPGQASAYDGLGRLLARLGRGAEAAPILVIAAASEGLPRARAAEAATLAARCFIDLEQHAEAEAVLRRALERSRDSQRTLLELARLYEQEGRRDELGQVLDELAELPLPSAMLAEVAYRRALQLRPIYERVPTGPQGERARSYLLEALGANPRHTAARRALLALASDRREWSIVAHMHYLAIRELPPGSQRAIVHLDLATTYLEHLGDPKSAMRNIESALQQAATDVIVANRTGELARRMPSRKDAAERFENIAGGDNELDNPARARLWLLAADLRMEDDDRDAAEAASKRVLDLPAVPHDAAAAATRTLERLGSGDPESLSAASSGVLARLEDQPPPKPEERAQLLGRLHDIGAALGDDALVQRATTEQRTLAAELDESDDQASTTSALLRDLMAARGEYGPVVELYERLASSAGVDDPARAASVLVEAAGYAWRGQNEPVQAASLLGRALELAPRDEAAARMLAEITHDHGDPAAAQAIARTLDRIPIDARPPVLTLKLAGLASARGADAEALALVRPLTLPGLPDSVRLSALAQLETLLAARGDHGERRRVLSDYFALAKDHADPRAGDLGLELARLQRDEGDRAAARRTCEAAREVAPDHRDILRLQAEFTELDEDWPALVFLQEELAQLATDDAEQASWLTRAAQNYLAHPDLQGRGDPSQQARRLLLRACEVDPRGVSPRVTLLPLTFRQARWDETLDLGSELVHGGGSDEEVLVLAALAEAYHRGQRHLALEIGFRHPPEVARQWVLPGLQQTLNEVAMRGPLPRLDTVLAATSALLGGRRSLFEALHAWASERPPEAGLALGLARLLEARGSGDSARHQYQLAAFLAPRGPVPMLVARLPSTRVSGLDLHLISTAPMESRSILREVVAALRDHLSGLGTAGSPHPAEPHRRSPSWWQTRMELAETIIEPWRALLGLDLPLAWTEADVPGGVVVRNDRPPRLVLGRVSATLGRPELAFRLGYATATVALGLAALESQSLKLDDLLDALGQLANPAHRPTGHQALALSDVLAAREAHTIGLTSGQRAGLIDELAHWLTTEGGLVRLHGVLDRARLLLACRLSGHLDGALASIARTHGLIREGRTDTTATLRVDDTSWLLRALSLR